MEPTTQPTLNKNKKMLTIIVLIIIAIIVIILLRSKVSTPIVTEESKQLTAEIDSAVTFDNEIDLIEIDKEF